jgi:transposase
MTRKRRTHSPEFKARVALEALKEIKPIHQIASENEVYPAQVAQWKKELKARMAELFERKNGRSQKDEEDERMIASLERKVGQLTIERDWLEKKSKELGID